jgi:hypothetical protein
MTWQKSRVKFHLLRAGFMNSPWKFYNPSNKKTYKKLLSDIAYLYQYPVSDDTLYENLCVRIIDFSTNNTENGATVE